MATIRTPTLITIRTLTTRTPTLIIIKNTNADNNQEHQSDDLDNSDNKIASSSTEPDEVAFSGEEELSVTPIAGSDKVEASCGAQLLTFVFTQPKDENGNPIPKSVLLN